MATMLPKIRGNFQGPYSEKIVYEELDTLSKEYYVFHSLDWVRPKKKSNFTFYENDFVILHKKYGIIFLEVKGGVCYFKDGICHQVNSETGGDTALDSGNDPLKQAKRGIYKYRKLIEEKLGKQVEVSVEPVIWFPGCKFDRNQPLPVAYKDILFAILDDSALSKISGVEFEKRLRKIYTEYDAYNATELTDEQFNAIKDIIAPDFALVPSPAYSKLELDEAFLRLTNEQSTLLDYIEEQNYVAIQGAAGTGKTMIANMAAENFAKQGRRVLFLCYNRFLYEYLSAQPTYMNIDYYNIDKFVVQYCQMEAGSVSKRLTAYEKAIDYDDFPYDDIIIDEAQDFGNKEIFFFKELCELRDSHLYLFFDKNQVVNRRHSVIDADGREDNSPEAVEPLTWIEKSECRLVLSVNCRNTVQIAKSAYSVIDHKVKDRENKREINGDRPTIVFAEDDVLSKLEEVIQYYLKNGYKPEDITILSMKGQSESLLNGKTAINKIPISFEQKKGHVRSTTARKFKGLENKVIIITDIDEECFGDSDIKNVFYVACTRARQGLTMVVQADSEKIKFIAQNIEGLGTSMSPTGKIITKTQTKLFKA